jgi:dTDP-4-dehydrorhamnose 3,5-epimerase
MRWLPTPIGGCVLVEPEPLIDRRGLFVRIYDHGAFASAGLRADPVQCSLSFNERKGTLRGLHFQAPPFAEVKLVRCTRGSAFDVAVDLRAGSLTYGTWVGQKLSQDNRLALLIPEGCAHGFLTLQDETEMMYQISTAYEPDASAGVRWDDPHLDIEWPIAGDLVMSSRDRTLPTLEYLAQHEGLP